MSAHTTMHAPHTNAPMHYVPTITHNAYTNRAAHTHGLLNDRRTAILLDSGASCSVISKPHVYRTVIEPIHTVRLVNADGGDITPRGVAIMTIGLGKFSAKHKFVVVDHLSTPVILGCDFLMRHGYVLDFQQCTYHRSQNPEEVLQLQPAWGHPPHTMPQPLHTITVDDECPQAIPIPCKQTSIPTVDMPTDIHPALNATLEEFKSLFSPELGRTNTTEHIIDTGNALPIKVPPRPIPFHYSERVHQQLQEMAQEGIIQPSTSPWCAPAVYVPKPSGEIRICVDYVQLNSVTKKDSYPVPRAEGPQQKLAGKKVFSKLDLRSAYWQFPMQPQSVEKTAFCPGPGYGLWEFTRMPYGLTGATQTCQRGLDNILQDCKDCVDNYVDDCIVFSDNMATHIQDLKRVLHKLSAAGFTLRGSKCFFGKNNTTHLGFDYSADGVAPSPEKTKAISTWPVPKTTKDLRSFLGLVNFYRRFVHNFADIASPLTELTGKHAQYKWENTHQHAFDKLKHALTNPPILDYPKQHDTFVLTTDASDMGLGAVLSTTRGTVVEYASRTLTKTERNYSTTEKECLAIVWATQKLRHYLVGAHFVIETDHKPLEWLESKRSSHARSQKLERWALQLRGFDFSIVYRQGSQNQHADALSRRPIAMVAIGRDLDHTMITAAQKSDPVLQTLIQQMSCKEKPSLTGNWRKFPLKRYHQLWSQLTLHQSILYRKVKTPTMHEEKLLLVAPASMRKQLLKNAHDNAGHQGADRTMARLSEAVYWVGMGKDVNTHCSHCVTCQHTKAAASRPAPLQPVVASRPWELVAVDILKVPMSRQGNQYMLVVQDYFSKWPFAVPLSDQTANKIVQALKDQVFTLVGPPQRLHSDQGRNFESQILSELCKAFGVTKSRTTPYHPMGDGLVERMNRSILNMLRGLVDKEGDWEEHLQLLLYLYRTTKHATTGLSPHEILFGSNPTPLNLPTADTVSHRDPHNYSSQLQGRLLELKELVECNTVEAATRQQQNYGGNEQVSLQVGQEVLLDNPTKGKLDPRWTGPWTVRELKGPLNVRIEMNGKERVVHVNRLRPLLRPDVRSKNSEGQWGPPLFQYYCDDRPASAPRQESPAAPQSGQPVTTRSGRVVRPVDYYGY